MTELIATRGLPGAGKTTWALAQLAADPSLKRCNRDQLRRMIDGRPTYSVASEDIVTEVHHAAIRASLRLGYSVVVDDVNLDPVHLRQLAVLADEHDAQFVVQDFTSVPIETCIERDRQRPVDERVGEAVIRDFNGRYLDPADLVGDPL